MKIGEYFLRHDEITINEGRRAVVIVVRNTGDRPIQIGSHFHFFEVNSAMEFNRSHAYGMRLDIPSGTAARFEPGDEREVQLVEIGGSREVFGHRGMVNGKLTSQGADA
jgi:urease subunit beta